MSEFTVQDLTNSDEEPPDLYSTYWQGALEVYCIQNRRWGYDYPATFSVPGRVYAKSVGLTVDVEVSLGFIKKDNPEITKFVVVIQKVNRSQIIATASSEVEFIAPNNSWKPVGEQKYRSKLFSPGETIDILTRVADSIREAPVESCTVEEITISADLSLPSALDTFHTN